MEQQNLFSENTAAGPSKILPKNHLHAVQGTTSDHS